MAGGYMSALGGSGGTSLQSMYFMVRQREREEERERERDLLFEAVEDYSLSWILAY